MCMHAASKEGKSELYGVIRASARISRRRRRRGKGKDKVV